MSQTKLHDTEAHDEAELIDGLEPDQLVAVSSKPLPRIRVSRGWSLFFWALRLFVLLMTALVVYVFIVNLHS